MFSKFDCRILTLLFLIVGPLPSQGFFWPFTSWSKSHQSNSPSSSSLFKNFFQPYSDSDQTPSSSDSDTVFSEFLPDGPNTVGLFDENNVMIGHGHHGPVDQFIPMDGVEPWAQSTQMYPHPPLLPLGSQQQPPALQPNSPQQQQQQEHQQFQMGRQQQQQQQQQGPPMAGLQQQQPQQQSSFPYPENAYDSKRLGYVTRQQMNAANIRQQQQQLQSENQNVVASNLNAPAAVTGPSRFVLSGDNQYLIIQKPGAQQQQQSQQQQQLQADRAEIIENQNVMQQQSNQMIQNSFPASNWVYISPVNKLNSPQQPIILEAYIESGNPNSPQPTQQQSQQLATKGTKTRQSSSSIYGQQQQQQQRGIKIPLLSWLPTSTSQIHLPQWLKSSKSQQSQQLETQNLNQQPQQFVHSSSVSYVTNPNVVNTQKPIYLLTPGPSAQQTLSGINGAISSSNLVSSAGVSGSSSSSSSNYDHGSSGGSFYIQMPVIRQVEIKPQPLTTTSQQQPPQVIGSTSQVLWADQNSNQNPIQSQQFWIESSQPQQLQPSSAQSATRVQFPKLQQNNNVQEYQVIRSTTTTTGGGVSGSSGSSNSNNPIELTPGSQSMVSQIDSNQDLGGWDSIQMADIVKPGISMDTSESQQQLSQSDQSSLSSVSSTSLLDVPTSMNETSSVQQQPSHRIVYQPMSSSAAVSNNSSSIVPSTNIGARSTPSSSSSSSLFSNYQYSPIYQLIQQSQQQSSPSSSSGGNGSGTGSTQTN